MHTKNHMLYCHRYNLLEIRQFLKIENHNKYEYLQLQINFSICQSDPGMLLIQVPLWNLPEAHLQVLNHWQCSHELHSESTVHFLPSSANTTHQKNFQMSANLKIQYNNT